MKTILAAALSTVLIACATVDSVESVRSSVTAKQYNRVAAQFLDRPTSVSLGKMSDGLVVLHVRYARYGDGFGGAFLLKGHAASYSAHIEKFLEWSRLADERGEILTKEIGRADTWRPGASGAGALRFTFHSGAPRQHYLQLAECSLIGCIEETSMYVDAGGARELMRLVKELDAGTLRASNSSVYK